MACYKFYQDTKHTIWQRTYFTITAPNKNAALCRAARIAKSDLRVEQEQLSGFTVGESEILNDSLEDLPLEDNNEQPTIEIFLDSGEDVANNVSGSAWDAWWPELDAGDMERITGLRRSDFSTEKDCEDFIVACIQWWNSHSETEKIAVWKEYRE